MSYNPYLSPSAVDGEPISIPIVFWDDFITAGYSQDLGLSNESDPSGHFSEVADAGVWNVSLVTSGVVEVITATDNKSGGYLTVTTDVADNDVVSLQVNGEAFAMAAGKKLIFEVKFQITDVSQADWFVGLAVSDTSLLGGVTDRIGFECPDSTGDIDAITEKDNTQTSTDTLSDIADATDVILRVEVTGTGTARFFVDGNLKATHTVNLPDDLALTPSIEIRNSTGNASTMKLDYVFAYRDR